MEQGSGQRKPNYRTEVLALYRLNKSLMSCANPDCLDGQNIELHHIDPKTKSDTVANIVFTGGDMRSFVCEITKCAPLCHACHVQIHRDMRRASWQAPYWLKQWEVVYG